MGASCGLCSCCGSHLDLAVGLQTCSSDLNLLLYLFSASVTSWSLPLFHCSFPFPGLALGSHCVPGPAWHFRIR